ncbi:MAG: hypothetical protein ABIH99_04410 [Candidatus Micrarchaeota archaeon]
MAQSQQPKNHSNPASSLFTISYKLGSQWLQVAKKAEPVSHFHSSAPLSETIHTSLDASKEESRQPEIRTRDMIKNDIIHLFSILNKNQFSVPLEFDGLRIAQRLMDNVNYFYIDFTRGGEIVRNYSLRTFLPPMHVPTNGFPRPLLNFLYIPNGEREGMAKNTLWFNHEGAEAIVTVLEGFWVESAVNEGEAGIVIRSNSLGNEKECLNRRAVDESLLAFGENEKDSFLYLLSNADPPLWKGLNSMPGSLD